MVLGTPKTDGLKLVKNGFGHPQNRWSEIGQKMVSDTPKTNGLKFVKKLISKWSENCLKFLSGATRSLLGAWGGYI